MPEAASKGISCELDGLHERYQDGHGAQRHSRTESLVAVAYGEIAESAGADGSSHGGKADQGDGHQGGGAQQRRKSLGQLVKSD